MRQHQKFHSFFEEEDKGRPEPVLKIPFPFLFPEPALTIPFPLFPEPALTIPFPANKFPNKLAPKVPKTYLKIFLFVL